MTRQKACIRPFASLNIEKISENAENTAWKRLPKFEICEKIDKVLN
jgi:hypothetical protein